MVNKRARVRRIGSALAGLLALLGFALAGAACFAWILSVSYPSAGFSLGSNWYTRKGLPLSVIPDIFTSVAWIDARGTRRCVSVEHGYLVYTAVWDVRYDNDYPMSGESGEWTFIAMWRRWGIGLFRADFAGMESARIRIVSAHLCWIIAASMLPPGLWVAAVVCQRASHGKRRRRNGFPVQLVEPAHERHRRGSREG